jgi:undecaprenyl-diphosphatase
MSMLHSIVLGIVQGLTEFLPISSSGHLILVPWLFGWEEPGLSFDAALHLGSLVAVFAYFWRELLGMVLAVPTALRRPTALFRGPASSAAPRERDARLVWLLILGSIPGGIAGLLLQDRIDSFFHDVAHQDRTVLLIAIVLATVALLLLVADRRGKQTRAIGDLGPGDAVAIGVAQMCALFPGVSRSGITLTTGLLRDIRRADAARFSFLLGTPLVTLAGFKGFYDLISDGTGGVGTGPLVLGILASALSGFAAIAVLLRFLQRSSATVFVVYRVVAGLAIIIILATNLR